MTLYLVSACGFGNFHVLANSSDEAIDCLIRALNDANHDCSNDKIVFNVRIITSTIEPKGYGTEKEKPHLSDEF